MFSAASPNLDRMSFAPDHEKNRLAKLELSRSLKAARQLELQANVDVALVSFFFLVFAGEVEVRANPLLTKLTRNAGVPRVYIFV